MNMHLCEPVLLSFAGDVFQRCNEYQREAFTERAGILEFDAGDQPRALAEALAVLDLLRRFPSLLTGLVALEVEVEGVRQCLLSHDLNHARFVLDQMGGVEVAVRDPAELIQSQFGGVARLSRLA